MNVIEQIDAEIARLQDAKATLARFLLPAKATTKAVTKGRAKAGSGDEVILSAIRQGADTMKQIAVSAKVTPSAAHTAVTRLLAAKKVTSTGMTSKRRYAAK